MAHSSIGHMGFALSVWRLAPNKAFNCVGLYDAVYDVGWGFYCILYMKVKGKMVENIKDLSGLFQSPYGSRDVDFDVFHAGIPPFIGFENIMSLSPVLKRV